MSVALDVNTVTTTLWPAVGRVTRPTGQFVNVTLVGRGTTRFTNIAFDPNDEATFYASSSDAAVYIFSLRGNSVKLFAALEHPISAMACCGSSESPMFACATEDGTLVWIDCSTSRILRREKTPHQHTIRMIRAPAWRGCMWMATLSCDTLAVWNVTQMVCGMHSHMTTGNTRHNFMTVHAERNLIVTVEFSGRVTTWDAGTLLPIRAVVVDMRPRTAVACQNFIAIGGADATVGFLKTVDLSSINLVQLSTAPAATRSLSIINDDLLACELTDGTIVFMVVSSYSVSFAMAAPYSGAVPKRPATFNASGPSFGVFTHGEQLTLFHLPTARQYYLRHTRWNGSDPSPQLPRQVYPFVQERSATRTEAHALMEEESISDTTLPRPTVKLSKLQVSKWVKVDLLNSDSNAARSSGCIRETVPNRKAQERSSVEVSNKEKELSLRPFLDRASRAANMEYLRRLLMRYGVFPEKYRLITWRFLLQLPERRFTAPQYAQLLAKGPHQSVPFLMKPFPLKDKKLRSSMERVLSILAWHVPMFSVIHFLPMVVYPFLRVCGDDTQSIVEIVLAFLSNWGKEFFQYYPERPVTLMTLLNQLLRSEDVELHSHLEQRGIVAEEWGWEALSSLYTDILTSPAWLQVMDHAFFNTPLWLFLFHIQWLVSIHDKLMELPGEGELRAALLTTHSIDVNSVIAETYRLYEQFPKEELTIPYSKFHTFVDYVYPTLWKYNEETINQKLADLQQTLQQKERMEEARQRIHGVGDQLSQAEILKEVFIERKRAEVAARLTAASDSWKHEVTREKESQQVRDMENMTRLQTMQQQIEHAERLEALHEEIASARGQVADLLQTREKEALHWRRAERLTGHELERLENAAQERLARAMKALQEEEEKVEQLNQRDTSHVSAEEVFPCQAPPSPPATAATPPPVAHSAANSKPPTEVPSCPVEAYRMLQSCATRGVGEAIRPVDDHSLPVPLPHSSSSPAADGASASAAAAVAIHHPLTGSNRSAPSGPLYDNLLASGMSSSRSETYKSTTTASHLQEQRCSGNCDERSSAGTVLLRPRGPEAYRLLRPPH
ncbi:hypothetical protein DQ04_01401010 [Trypanosoma grayi]|uniref:hypothetical protein n=1 Tax=Trypanosoma grayi TaxID=71804 RepID=UPI0004F452D8|nr:hypothetical protein DQ04_01401010 [Trypanosoma grayi]KEG12817.1 hypothetical protein DQ04_01401010 [Trypanosoma grayi]